jgi:hypothetical protein
MSKKVKIILISITTLFSLVTLIGSYYYSVRTGGMDLRNRVVGSRLMYKGNSPYFYKWNPADGERLLDPNDDRLRLANGNTVTPAVFIILYPFNSLEYPKIRLIWTTIQLVIMTIIIWMMLKRNERNSRLQSTAVVIPGLLASNYWFMHVERGQIHIFYLFLFVSMYFVYTAKWKYAEFFSGFIGGLFIFFRPFAAMVFLGFLLNGNIKWIRGWVAGLIAGLLFFVIPFVPVWKDYFKAMEEYGNECLGKGHHLPASNEVKYPVLTEGAANLRKSESFKITNLPAAYGFVRHLNIEYTPAVSWLVCGIILLILSLLFFKREKRRPTISLFLFAFLTYITAELFMLSWRNPYAIILWIFPLFLILQKIQYKPALLILLCTALLFMHQLPFYFRFQMVISESILLSFTAYLSFYLPPAAHDGLLDQGGLLNTN